MGDVICVELSSEDLSEELKEVRDTFLTDLLNHIMDVSAHVRSKVLQVWNHVKVENSVPLVWQNRVLKMAADRLDDKGTMVRKHAIHLIKAFLETNPFAANVSVITCLYHMNVFCRWEIYLRQRHVHFILLFPFFLLLPRIGLYPHVCVDFFGIVRSLC